MLRKESRGKGTVVLHLGDHDPSGIDMTRDLQDRFHGFGAGTVVERLALNMGQVDEYAPPPNPAKMTDSRAEGYVAAYGDESWELDALEPSLLNSVILDAVDPYLDMERWEASTAELERERASLRKIETHWDSVKAYVDRLPDVE
jgi:hypothetical protein